MRIAVLILGLLGAAGAGFLGYQWMSDYAREEPEITQKRRGAVALGADPSAIPEVAELDGKLKSIPLLLAGAGLGLFGVFLVLRDRLGGAGLLFLIAILGPAVFAPLSLAYTSGLALAGLLALFLKFRSPPVPALA